MAIAPAMNGMAESIGISDTSQRMHDAAELVAFYAQGDDSPALPAAHIEAAERFRLARTVLTAPSQSEFAWPAKTTAAEIRKAIRTEAERRSADRLMRVVAAEAAEMAAGQSLQTLRVIVPEVLQRLDEQFRRAAQDFITASAAAPQRLTGMDNQEGVDAFIARSASAARLDDLVRRRLGIGGALVEAHCSPGSLWPFSEPPAVRTIPANDTGPLGRRTPARIEAEDQERLNLLAEISKGYYADQRGWGEKDPVDRWHDLLAVITPSIAAFSVTESRAERWNQLSAQAEQGIWMTGLGERDRLATLPGKLNAQFSTRIRENTAVLTS